MLHCFLFSFLKLFAFWVLFNFRFFGFLMRFSHLGFCFWCDCWEIYCLLLMDIVVFPFFLHGFIYWCEMIGRLCFYEWMLFNFYCFWLLFWYWFFRKVCWRIFEFRGFGLLKVLWIWIWGIILCCWWIGCLQNLLLRLRLRAGIGPCKQQHHHKLMTWKLLWMIILKKWSLEMLWPQGNWLSAGYVRMRMWIQIWRHLVLVVAAWRFVLFAINLICIFFSFKVLFNCWVICLFSFERQLLILWTPDWYWVAIIFIANLILKVTFCIFGKVWFLNPHLPQNCHVEATLFSWLFYFHLC